MISISSLLLPYSNGNPASYRVYSHGSGVYLYTSDGRKVLDGLSGSMNANLGHGNALVAAAMREQSLSLTSLPSIAGDVSEQGMSLADKLCRFLGIPDFTCTFSSSGSEATETALAVIWKYWADMGQPERKRILSLDNSYHGCTLGALAVTGRIDEHADIPLAVPDFRIALPSWDPEKPGCVSAALEQIVMSDGSKDIAAIFLEPVMGLAGMIPAASDDIRRVVEICREHHILVVLDEALTGLGRTGYLTAADLYGIEYDLLLISKGLGCGFASIASTCIAPRVASVLQNASPTLRHGHTASGNPLSARIASTILDELEVHNITTNALRMGNLFAEEISAGISSLHQEYSVRATGLCLAIETDDVMHAQAVVRIAYELGLRIRAIDENVILCPPLIISQSETEKLVVLVYNALAAAEKGLPIT